MFKINRYKYVDVNTRSKFEVFARNVEFADNLIKRVNKLGVFTLRRAKLFFCKPMRSDIPPFEIEQEQVSTIEDWEAKRDGQTKKWELNNHFTTR